MGAATLQRAGEDAAPEQNDDWYANLVDVRGCRCVLFTHVETLFPLLSVGLEPADLTELTPRLRDGYAAALRELGVPRARVAAELLRLGDPKIARTCSRRVLGSMKEHVAHLGELVEREGGIDESAALRFALEVARAPLNALDQASAVEALRRRLG